MVFNFWHFLPKLGHLVLKLKKLLAFKKDRSAFDSHAIRTLVTNWVFELSNKNREFATPQPRVAKKE